MGLASCPPATAIFIANSMNEMTNQNPLTIKENICFQIDNLQIEIISYLGQLTPDIYYFQVNIISEKPGLLRIGATNSALNREL